MDSVKRRLVYVADDDERLLNDLTGSPPTRPSRLSHLHISSSQQSEEGKTSNAGAPTANAAEHLPIIISYDGFLLADGSGTLHSPRNAREATLIYNALRECQQFLQGFLNPSQRTEGSHSLEGTSSSTTYADVDDETGSEESSLYESSPKRKRKDVTSKSSQRPAQPTVAVLRGRLRSRGLPVAGTKDTLLARLRLFEESEGKPVVQEDSAPGGRTGASSPPLKISPTRLSTVSGGCGSSHSSPSDFQSPVSRASTSSRGFWGAIVNVGSLFFRPSPKTVRDPHGQ